MANRRQQKKAAKRAQKELQRRREQEAAMEKLALSSTEKEAVNNLVQKAQQEEINTGVEADNEMVKEAQPVAQAIKPPKPTPATPEETAAPRAEAPQTRSIFRRAMEAPGALAGVAASAIGNIRLNAPTAEQKATRSEIVKINNQLILTTKIIDSNKEELEKLAATDSNVAKILQVANSDQLKAIKGIQDRILAGDEISAADTEKLIGSLQEVTHTISATKVSLEAKFSDVTGNFQSLILNNDLERDDRRMMLDELVKIATSSEIQKQLTDEQKAAILELEKMSGENLNFSDDQQKRLNDIFLQLKSEDLEKIKLRGTLTDLNEQIESMVLTEEELAKRLGEKDEKGNSLQDKLKEGVKSTGQTLKAGGIDLLLSQVGLGGLGIGDALAEVGFKDMGKFALGAGGLLNKIPGVGKLGGFGSKMGGKLLGGVGSKVGGILGKAALPLAALSAGYGAFQGFSNADEIAGTEPGQATLGQKLQAGAAGALGGLGLGLVFDDKEIYGGIEKGIDFLFGKDKGLLPMAGNFLKKVFEFTPIGFIITHFDTIKKGFSALFGADGIIMKMAKFVTELPLMLFNGIKEIFTSPESFVQKITEGFGQAFDFLFGEGGLFTTDTIKRAFKEAGRAVLPDWILRRMDGDAVAPSQGAVPTRANIPRDGNAARVNNRAADMATDAYRQERADRAATAAATQAGKTVVVTAPAASQQSSAPRTVRNDDVHLAVMNAGMAGI